MKYTFNEKHIIVSFCVLFFISAAFLFWKNGQELNPDQDKSWWILSFAAPSESTVMDFLIENHSDSEQFHYELRQDKVLIEQRDIILVKGSTTTIIPQTSNRTTKRTVISVTSQGETKEIYR